VPLDEFAVACLMAVERKAGLARDQQVKERLALDERQSHEIPTVNVQEIESVIDKPDPALAVGRRLNWAKLGNPASSTPQSSPSMLSSFRPHIGKSLDDAWIFVGPVEPGPSQELPAAMIDTRGHAKAVQLYFMVPH
jgi:hypothetical protein